MDENIRDLLVSDLTEAKCRLLLPLMPKHTLDDLRRNLNVRIVAGEITVATFVNEEIVGSAGATINNKLDGRRIAFIEDVYVLPEYRQQGIATKMLNYLADRLWQDLDCDEALARIRVDNTTMNEIAERRGSTVETGNWWQKRNPNRR